MGEELNGLVKIILNKGFCHHTRRRAFSALSRLKPLISAADYDELSIALEHSAIEGPEELATVCKALMKKEAIDAIHNARNKI
jgi:hypothetical protein